MSQPQAVELFIERGAHAVVDLRRYKHLSVLRMVADGFDAVQAVSFHDLGATQDAVGGIGSLLVEVGSIGALVCDGFTGERRLVDIEGHRLQQRAVSRNLHAGVEYDNVAHDDVTPGHHRTVALANHLHRLVVVDLVEYGKLLAGLHLKVKRDARGQKDSHKDAHRFKKHIGTLV